MVSRALSTSHPALNAPGLTDGSPSVGALVYFYNFILISASGFISLLSSIMASLVDPGNTLALDSSPETGSPGLQRPRVQSSASLENPLF